MQQATRRARSRRVIGVTGKLSTEERKSDAASGATGKTLTNQGNRRSDEARSGQYKV
jgi:hypothetical protein